MNFMYIYSLIMNTKNNIILLNKLFDDEIKKRCEILNINVSSLDYVYMSKLNILLHYYTKKEDIDKLLLNYHPKESRLKKYLPNYQ